MKFRLFLVGNHLLFYLDLWKHKIAFKENDIVITHRIPEELGSDTYKIGWEWLFTGDDAKDTELGEKVAEVDKIVSLPVNIIPTKVGQ